MFSLAIEANPKNTTYLVFRATTHLYLKNYSGALLLGGRDTLLYSCRCSCHGRHQQATRHRTRLAQDQRTERGLAVKGTHLLSTVYERAKSGTVWQHQHLAKAAMDDTEGVFHLLLQDSRRFRAAEGHHRPC